MVTDIRRKVKPVEAAEMYESLSTACQSLTKKDKGRNKPSMGSRKRRGGSESFDAKFPRTVATCGVRVGGRGGESVSDIVGQVVWGEQTKLTL